MASELNEGNYQLVLYRIDQLEKSLHGYLDDASEQRRDMVVRITRLEERQKFLERALAGATLIAAGAGAGHFPSFF